MTAINDKWLWVSALQKAIRRADTETAMRATAALWELDRKKFWARLHIIALEDVGIGNPDAVTEVLVAASSAGQYDMQSAQRLTAMLCAGAKNRLSDAIFILAQRSADYDALRMADDDTLTDYVLSDSQPLVERCLSIWLLTGTKRFPSNLIQRVGAVDNTISALKALPAPAPLTHACINAIRMSPYPLSVFLPLIWQEAQKYKCHVQHHDIPAMPDVAGLPLYAADGFTRVGRACFSALRKAAPELNRYSIEQIGLGVFYINGGRVDKELTSPELDAIQQGGELADLASAGLQSNDYQRLRDYLTLNMERLAVIRQQHLNDIQGKPTLTPSGSNGGAA